MSTSECPLKSHCIQWLATVKYKIEPLVPHSELLKGHPIFNVPVSLRACMLSHVWLCYPTDCSLPGFSVQDSPGKNTGVGFHALLEGIIPTQGWNPCLSMSPILASQIFATNITWEDLVSLQGESKYYLYYFTVQFLPLRNYAFVFLPRRCWSPEHWIINTLHAYFHLRMYFLHWESVMVPEVRWENRH